MHMCTSLYTLSLIQIIFQVVDYESFKFPFGASFLIFFPFKKVLDNIER